jgi:histidinol-phosphatase (PHP family)
MKTNYHSHTRWCDGKGTAEEMVLAAIHKGFDALGFSAHAMWPFGTTYHLQPKAYQLYVEDITSLKAKYAGQLPILLGYEADYFPPLSYPDKAAYAQWGADFLIGSTHFLTNTDGDAPETEGWFEVDAGADAVAQGIERRFGGDGKAAVQCYYDRVRQMLRRGGFTILGHADLIRKRNGILRFFDENDAWYKSEIEATAIEAARAGVIVEINTGGIARGAMNDVYPSADFLSRLGKRGVPVMINSDAHHGDHLGVGYDLAEQRARDAGYHGTVYLDSAGAVRDNPFP